MVSETVSLAKFNFCGEVIDYIVSNEILSQHDILSSVMFLNEEALIFEYIANFFKDEYPKMTYSEANKYLQFPNNYHAISMIQAITGERIITDKFSISNLIDVLNELQKVDFDKEVFFELMQRYNFSNPNYEKFLLAVDAYNNRLYMRFIYKMYYTHIWVKDDIVGTILRIYDLGGSFDDLKVDFFWYHFKRINEMLEKRGYVLLDSTRQNPIVDFLLWTTKINGELRKL